MLYGGLKETNELNVNISEAPVTFFKIILGYIYTGRIDLSALQEALQGILNRDTFYTNEVRIFNEVCRWITENQHDLDRDSKIKVLSAVRYNLMSNEELSEAKESKLISSDIVSDAIQLRNTLSTDKPQFRGQLKPNVSLTFVSRRSPDSRGFSDLYNRYGTNMIKLNTPSTINYIEKSLWNEVNVDKLKCYSYYVEVSRDEINWTRVIDYSNYNCRAIQRLWFPPCIAQYIRIVGTNSSANATFKIWLVKYNTEDMSTVEIENGFVIPKDNYNVASDFSDAIVIEGENNVNNISLLNTYYEDKARDDSYTWHRLESGCIVVHLTQPYILSSIRLLLWSGDNQAYSYTIQGSLDNQNWQMLVDKSEELTRSWQILNYEPTPMLYIRITGVKSSTGNDFRCVYLEAPNQVT
ncbi:BTB/POZ domain-containing protein 9-like [Adelges cooleyi]|uniref:BTB/POZ domain-containing protein 9-like n=1 Tax=Adelges cooleyi TaxID=133065 RepID=UPI00217F92F2|nr:BTB/POZ domain-containing protein 9-like [Adelges cooleyi]